MKKIGLLIPATNLTVEYEMQQLLKNNQIENVIFYTNRIPYKTNYKENKNQYLKELAENCQSKLEELEYLNLDYYAFFCTSSLILNKEKIGINNPSVSLVESAKHLNINKCLLITPYDDTTGQTVKVHLEENNVKVLKIINLNLLNTKEYFDYGINNLENLIINEYRDSYENIIISCTNLPTVHMMNLEKTLNTNIISSNLSMLWKMCKDNDIVTKKISNLFSKEY